MQDRAGEIQQRPRRPLGCLAMTLIIGLFICFAAINKMESDPPSIDGIVTLSDPGVGCVPFALDENALDRIIWLDNESPIYFFKWGDSMKALKELIDGGRVLKLGDANEPLSSIKTRVLETKLMDSDVPLLAPPHKVKVTIMSGINAEKTGWVSSRWVAK